ncbi:MAG: ATP-dependent Clp protease proteolytic subunit [Bacteriovoracaceae bacterium]|nr:ATP-dependent Clp protease proteolytic subunit [Bacteriovoracaceae bacterium]
MFSKIKIFRRILAIFTICFLSSNELAAEESNQEKTITVNSISRLEINSSINPATYSYLLSGFKEAFQKKSDLILIELNTPGGLVTTTKEILTLFGNSDRPVVVWIKPEGASATSAGAIIASGSHLLYMSEGTNIGAATPIQMGKDIEKESDMRKKAINDLVALVQSLSEARGRNPKLFGEMIEKAASFKAQEALQKNLVDGLANTQSELFKNLEGSKLRLKGQNYLLKLNNPQVTTIPMDMGQKLLNVLADPSTAYVLFLIGAALLYLEFQAAGGFIAGSIGAVCLILAGIGFQVLPLNFGALGLIIVAFILFIMEAFITSYGILSIAGLASLVAGSLFLFRTDDAYLSLSTSFILAVVSAIGAFLGICLFLIIRERKNVGKEKFNETLERHGVIVKLLREEAGHHIYQVKIGGEFWNAQSDEPFKVGDEIKVIAKVEGTMNLEISAI